MQHPRPDRDVAEAVIFAFPGEGFLLLPGLEDQIDPLLRHGAGLVARGVIGAVLVRRAAQEHHFHAAPAQRVEHADFLGQTAVENDLQQEIAKFVLQIDEIAAFDGVGEQIDALEIMGINTKTYLILPKILAGMLMIPLLIIISIAISIWGGYLAGLFSHVLTKQQFFEGLTTGFQPYNLFFAIAKAFVFSLIISIIPSYYGYYVEGGALEIGRASTTSVVVSCVLILCADYGLSIILL